MNLQYMKFVWSPQDGLVAVEYKALRDTPAIRQMLHDARTLDAYGEVRLSYRII